MGSMVSMSKGGGGGARELDDALMSLSLHPAGCPMGSLSPLRSGSQRPWRRRKNSISSSAEDGAGDGLHGALAAGAFQERVASPHPEDEVAPEGAHVAGGLRLGGARG